jgi:hypothetical protein
VAGVPGWAHGPELGSRSVKNTGGGLECTQSLCVCPRVGHKEARKHVAGVLGWVGARAGGYVGCECVRSSGIEG